MQSVLAPLRTPLFRRLWVANMTSNLGTMLQAVGAAWLMLSMTDSPEMVALVNSCITLPILALSLFAGALADTLDRRLMMLFAQVFMLVMALALTILVIADSITPNLLLLFTLLIGCGGALHIPAWQASLRDLVPREDVPASVALTSMAFNLMRAIGPAAGGLVLALFGAAVLFSLNVLSYIPLVFALSLWRPNWERATVNRERLGAAVLSGLRYSSMSPDLMRVILRGAMFCTGSVALVALLPVVAARMHGGDSFLFGSLLGAFGFGAVFAAIGMPTLRSRLDNERIARLAMALAGLALLSIALAGNVIVTFLGAFVAGSCWVMANSLFNVIIQLSTPKWVVGRALSLLHTGLFGGMAIGSWVWGVLAEAQSTPFALSVAAVWLFVGAAIGLFLPLPEIPDGGGMEPANRFQPPNPRLDLSRRSGPIGVAIRYHIAPEDVPEFLSVMRRHRQARKRDGAQRWMLMRDIENPEIWHETYHVATWTEYVRHNQRRITADIEVVDKLWDLHQGPEPPIIVRMLEYETVPDADDTEPLSDGPD